MGAFSEIEIDVANTGDAIGINQVQKSSWLATYPNEDFGISKEDILSKDWDDPARIERWTGVIKGMGPKLRVLVAKKEGRVVGFCSIGKRPLKGVVYALYILPELKGMGLGLRIMQKSLEWFGEWTNVYLNVVKYNEGAIRFYSKLGFEIVSEIATTPYAILPTGKAMPEIEMVKKAKGLFAALIRLANYTYRRLREVIHQPVENKAYAFAKN